MTNLLTVKRIFQKLDTLLGGGLNIGCIYEICGMPSSGKSQICMTIVANFVLSSSTPVHYIDTKDDFCATRILQILESRNCSDEQIGNVMNLIKVTRVKNVSELLTFVFHLIDKFNSDSNSTESLIIIDSLPAVFFKTSSNRNIFYSQLNHLSNACKFLSKECKQVIITTNIVSQWREVDGFIRKEQMNPTILKPTLGKYWTRIPNTRLLMDQLENEDRKISIWHSANLQRSASINVSITDAGVE